MVQFIVLAILIIKRIKININMLLMAKKYIHLTVTLPRERVVHPKWVGTPCTYVRQHDNISFILIWSIHSVSFFAV